MTSRITYSGQKEIRSYTYFLVFLLLNAMEIHEFVEMLREVVLASAAEVLTAELRRLPEESVATIASDCAFEVTNVQDQLIALCLEPLLSPLGDATTKLSDASSEHEIRMVADLYWRCCVAVAQMPLAVLQGLARHHTDLMPFLAAPDASVHEQRRALVRAILVGAVGIEPRRLLS